MRRANFQGERTPSLPSVDGFKRVVIGLHLFLPDFSECSECTLVLTLVHEGKEQHFALP